MLKTRFHSRKGFVIYSGDDEESDEESKQWMFPQSTFVTNGFDQLFKVRNVNTINDDDDGYQLFEQPDWAQDLTADTQYLALGDEGETRRPQQEIGNRKRANKKQKKPTKAKTKRQQKLTAKNDHSTERSAISQPSNLSTLNSLLKSVRSELSNSDGSPHTFYDVSLYEEDLNNLADDEWLNDNNVSFIYEYIERFYITRCLSDKLQFSSKEMVNSQIILLRPSMVFLLAHSTPKDVQDFLPPLDKSGFIFLPLNDNDDLEMAEGGSHWCLLVVAVHDNKCFLYDSLENANLTESVALVSKLSTLLNRRIQLVENTHCPQQINGSDCGVITTQITALLVSRLLCVLPGHPINLDLQNVAINAISGRIFMLKLLQHVLNN
ncbi:hypothetical protein LJB42_003216 [Komagataella kurtzmanii]|nr:hypothetical protein LJB42_003216 [Komagataella kurtzmanii]